MNWAMTSNEVTANIENAAINAEKIKDNAHQALQRAHPTNDSINVLAGDRTISKPNCSARRSESRNQSSCYYDSEKCSGTN